MLLNDSVLGTIAVQMSPPDMLEKLIPFLIAAIGIYTLFAPSLGEVEAEPRVSESTWQRVVAPLIGFYDGYVGPGTGMFFALLMWHYVVDKSSLLQGRQKY